MEHRPHCSFIYNYISIFGYVPEYFPLIFTSNLNYLHVTDEESQFSQFSCPVLSDSLIPWMAAHQASLSITYSRSLLKLMSIKSVMPSNRLILCCSLHLLPSIFSSIRVFSNESALHIRWPKYWSFSFSISPSNEYSGLISLGLTGLILPSKGLSRVFSNSTVQKHQFFGAQFSFFFFFFFFFFIFFQLSL